ncbi:MAG: hypothetical protein U1C18_00600 [Patescibacteria group bacterium]|nr:hypothetical protein [Patescibacteria group bacterium]
MAPRRILASLFPILGFSAFLAMPQPVFAQRSEAGKDALKFLDATAKSGGLSSGLKGEDHSSEEAVLRIIGNIISVILGFIGILFFIQMFYSGFRWMSSGGNEEVVTEAKQTIRNAVIGIVVVFAAFVVTNFVLNQIANITGPATPSADFVQPTDTGDPNLTAPSNEDLFGNLPDAPPPPDPLGACSYPGVLQCDPSIPSTQWTGFATNISQDDCIRNAVASCRDLGTTMYEWGE